MQGFVLSKAHSGCRVEGLQVAGGRGWRGGGREGEWLWGLRGLHSILAIAQLQEQPASP